MKLETLYKANALRESVLKCQSVLDGTRDSREIYIRCNDVHFVATGEFRDKLKDLLSEELKRMEQEFDTL